MTLSGIVASPASCWDFSRISTWSVWSWNLSGIEVSPLLPVTASEAGCNVWKMTSHRDRFWHPSFSISMCTIFLQRSLEGMLMPMIWHCYTLLMTGRSWRGVLSQDMTTISTYLQTWRLQLSHTKTVTMAFRLNNREAKRELNVYNNGRRLPFCSVPTYLGAKLDRSLTFRHHLEALRKN